MAARIQQRFWYSHARWNTKRRLAHKLRQAGLQYRTDHPLLNIDVFVSRLRGPTIHAVLPQWLKRHFATADEDLCAQLLAAYVFATYRAESVPSSEPLEHTAQLMDCAHRLVSHLDAMVTDDGLRATRSFVRMVQATMTQYLTAYGTWRSENEERVTTSLLKEALLYVHEGMSQRNPVVENTAGVMLCLIAKYGSILCRPVDALSKTVLKSNEMRVMRSLGDSAFWGPCNLSVFRLVHELMMDENFRLTPETTLSNLIDKYTPIPTSLLAITQLLVDLRAVVMWPIRDPDVLLDMARVMDIESMSWPEDVWGIANGLVPLLCGSMTQQHEGGSALAIFAQWHAMKATASVQQMLSFLLDAARRLRFMHGAMDLEQCRRHVRRHPSGFYPTQASLIISKAIHTKRAEIWMQQTLQTYAQDELERIAMGDPFALLGLHDHSIVDFALRGDLVTQFPETLAFDIPRLKLIRADLELACQDIKGQAFREKMQQLVDSNDDADLPESLADAVVQLRNIVFVSRFQHGETASLLARDVARRILDANAILDGRRNDVG